jgi:hypothetical protein
MLESSRNRTVSKFETRREQVEYYTLNELDAELEKGDLLVEGTATVRVDISIERLHSYVKDETGRVKLTLGEGWLVSLALPASDRLGADVEPFSDGEPQMVCDLKYLEEEGHSVRLKDALRALGIDKDLKIWRVKPAP